MTSRTIMKLYAIFVAAPLFTSCTAMTVTKVNSDNTDKTSGIRYSLPEPVLQLVPSNDGGMSVSVLYLPDSKHTYAISATSYLSSNQVEVDVDGGALTHVFWNGNAAGIAGTALTNAGVVASGIIEARAAAQASHDAAVLSAQNDVADKQGAVQAAQAKLSLLTASGNASDADISAAQAMLADANANLEASKRKLQLAQTTPTTPTPPTVASLGTDSATLPTLTDFSKSQGPPAQTLPVVITGRSDRPEVWGPVLYSIDENCDGVQLRPISIGDATEQSKFYTSRPTRIDQKEIILDPSGVIPVYPDQNKSTHFSVILSRSILKINGPPVLNPPKGPVPVTYSGATRTLNVQTDGLPAGDYTLQVPVTDIPGGEVTSVTIAFHQYGTSS